MKRNLMIAAVVLLVYIFFGTNISANAAGATLITIKNPGFEDTVISEDEVKFELPPGWQPYNPDSLLSLNPTTMWDSSVTSGNPTPNYYPEEAPEGQNVGVVYLAQAPGSGIAGLEQKLDAVLKPNTKYTLKVDVGNVGGSFEGFSLAGFPGYRVELLAGDAVIAADHNNVYIKDGTFNTSTVTFTATPDNPYLGQKLGIRLINLLHGPLANVDFDNVRLTAEPTGT
uniref:WelU2 n=1 Tax=Hapalosiphon welwitschii UTEX B 1830 TaxID=1433842 RepID=A0A067YVE8_9CYAN|nr:WelU2 [Hapalosiphon welwitschii UTEX B 1830]